MSSIETVVDWSEQPPRVVTHHPGGKRGPQHGGRRESDMEAFERLLKGSSYFRNTLASIERSAAAANAQVLGVLIDGGQLDPVRVMSVLRTMSTAFNPKANAEEASARRHAAAMLLDELAALSRQR